MVLPFNRLLKAAAVSAALLLGPAAYAAEADTQVLAEGDTNIAQLRDLGRDLRALLRPEIGFPEAYIGAWQSAVDEAFAPALLEADYLQALDAALMQDSRAAAVAYLQSDLATQLAAQTTTMDPDGTLSFEEEVAKAAKIIEAASPAQNALYVDLFERQHGPETANAIMDAYYRMMKTGAEPIIGAEAADAWVAGIGSTLRDQYVEGYFAATSAGYSTVDPVLLRELAQALAEPDLAAYSLQASQAFSQALDAAADRLAVAYAKAVADL